MNIFKKDSGETRTYTWDFTNVLADGETLSSVTGVTVYEADSTGAYASSSALTVGSTTLASPLVTAAVSGGVAGRMYVLECKCATSGGQAAIVTGGLSVHDTVG